MSQKINFLRKISIFYKQYAVIESEDLFGHFFSFTGAPNDSFTVVSALNKKHAVRRYAKRFKMKHNHYPKFYDSGMLLHRCAMRWGRYCVIEKESKLQTFYRL